MTSPYSRESHWRTSSHSGDGGYQQCVEYRPTSDRRIAVRDSKARAQGTCTFEPGAWAAFVRAIQERDTLA
ncbi:DUF397 domain-containing protein [Streptomyces mobaraensis NBRC 13819 = DSM 40847]|uniref:Uncharacterized protein n=1 Tax=Streptomyces mobaraensis (strain ATCC 29032 / DSM 40847 / JCM 4168 / NBRC 13819 / NCIMB 11159 / IPCR 16-22) TaxID=1223523 RepID=M3BCP2_STRM1|nr:DUF397 domain-containing protein [Streptomyces mobaraensis]EME97324.1 hypothetical protein H340_26971 [Streptomyces mobaraensis NBRC 13819 = DSM 40847]QTT73978.1 DUF397 domain-containing protein [Streptomyces mobaraensis NBRC 13819 = DSM 40847]